MRKKALLRVPFSAVLWTLAILLIVSFGTQQDVHIAVAQVSALIQATLDDNVPANPTQLNLINDVDSDGNADPGDTLRYTAVLTNTGAADAANVEFADTLPAGSSLVANSILVSPVAFDDTATVQQSTTQLIPVLDNDTNVDESAGWESSAIITLVTPPTHGSAVQSGTQVQYQHTDPDLSNATDSFTYTTTDVDGLTSSPATVSITIQDAAPSVTTTTPTDLATNVPDDSNIVVNFSENVNVTASTFTLDCPTAQPFTLIPAAPGGASSFTLDPTSNLPAGVTCTVIVAAAEVSDVDANDPPDNMAGDYTFTFTTDAAPEVVGTTPNDGGLSGTNDTITVNFSELVDVSDDWIVVNCSSFPGPYTPSSGRLDISPNTGPATNYVIDPMGVFTPGDTCTVTIDHTLVRDADEGDPPDTMAADYVFSFSVDQAPTVTGADPTDGAMGIPTDKVITLNFSENVAVTTASFAVECPDNTDVAFTLGGADDSYTLTPDTAWPEAATCAVTVFANLVSDTDAGDPPDTMAADYSFSFTTDAAPEVSSTDPTDGATNVPTNKAITLNFSENVAVTTASFAVECPDNTDIAFTLGGADGSYTLTPDTAWPEAATCAVTVFANLVSDTDAGDPPDTMAADYSFSFTTDAAPEVSRTDPTNGATNVPTDKVITVNFSESVNVTDDWVVVSCSSFPGPYTPSSGRLDISPNTGPATNYIIDPMGVFAPGDTCTVTIDHTLVRDADGGDPPDTMVADYVFIFTTDAAPNVTTTIPLDGATSIGTDDPITINFSENVNVTAGAFTLECLALSPQGFTMAPPVPGGTNSFTLTPSPALPDDTLCTVTVVAAEVTDTDANDPPDNMAVDYVFTFSTDQTPTVTSTTPDASNNAGNPWAVFDPITVTFSENVDVTANAFTVSCLPALTPAFTITPLPPGSTNSFDLDPTVGEWPELTTCTLTVVAAEVTDTDAGDPPNYMAVDYVVTFNTGPSDTAPSVTTVTPANNAVNVALDSSITVEFDEAVNVTASTFTLECPVATAIGFTLIPAAPSSANSFTLDPTTNLPENALCTVTVVAVQVTDVDSNDPPDPMAADYVFSFTTDQTPSVTTTTPANGATNVAVDTSIVVNFNEAVNVTASAFTLDCPTAQPFTLIPVVPGGVNSFTLDPTDDLPSGVTCTVTVVATQVSDVDLGDPPNTMAADHVFTFSTDAAPSVIANTPLDNATQVAQNTNLTVQFSEPVTLGATWFQIACASSGTRNVTDTAVSNDGLPQPTYTINPTTDFTPGELCTVTVNMAQVADTDADDPPDNLAGDFVFDFAIDSAPTVQSTSPLDDAIDVAVTSDITINFSEPVNATTSSFTIECPALGNLQAYTLSTSPASSFTLNPDNPLPGGVTCTVTVIAAQITDADAGDPPDSMAADYPFTFGTKPVAMNDDYDGVANDRVAIGNVPIDTANSSTFSLFTNDQPSSGITGVVARATFPAGTVNTSAQGGAVSVNTTTGTFSYTPPRGYSGADSFQYTIANAAGTSDPATVSLTVVGPLWFINGTADSGNDGTLNNAYDTIADFTTANTGVGANPADSDFIFIYEGNYVTGTLTLRNSQFVIGQDTNTANDLITDLVLTGGQIAPDSAALPPLQPASGGTATLAPGAANAIQVRAANTIRGLTVGNSTIGITQATALGTYTTLSIGGGTAVRDVAINNTTGQGLLFNTALQANGALDAYFSSITAKDGISLTSSSGTLRATSFSSTNAAGIGINIQTSSVSVDFDTTTVNNSTGIGLSLGTNSGAMDFGNTNVPNSGGTGVSLTSNTGALTFADLDIAPDSGQTALLATENTQTITTTSGTIAGTNAQGVIITKAATPNTPLAMVLTSISSSGGANGVNLTRVSGSFASTTTTVSDNTGVAVNISNSTATTINLGGGSITGGAGGDAVFIDTSSGTISYTGTITGGTNGVAGILSALNVNAGTATVNFSGTITGENTERVVTINGTTSGAVNLTGTVSNGAANSGSLGVNINNANGNVSFTTLTLGTSGTRMTNQAVTITNGSSAATYSLGTVSIFTSGANGVVSTNFDGTLNTTTGVVDASNATAINIDGPPNLTTLGMTLTNVTSVGGTTPGISLRETNGVFAVVGSGGSCTSAATCTGGSISGKTGASESSGTPGVRLFNVTNFRLTRMNISGNNHSGIYGGMVSNPSGVIDPSTINGFQLDNSNITANGDTSTSLPDETGVDLYNLAGTAIGGSNPTSITNTTISNNFEFELQITNTTGTLTDFQMSGNTISSNGLSGVHGNLINFLALGTNDMKLTITSGTFTGAAPATATAVQCDHSGTGGTLTCNISGATFTNNNVGPQASVAGNGHVVFNFSSNTITGSRAIGINLFADANPPFTKSIIGRIEHNTIGTLGVANSGANLGNGIRIQNEGAVNITLLINDNTVQEVTSFPGINANFGLGGIATGGQTSNLTILNNTVRNIGSRAIVIQDNQNSPNTPAPTICVDMSGNSFSGIAGQAGDGSFVRLRELNGVVNVRQLAPTAAANATELDDANSGNDPTNTKYAISGSVQFNAGLCTQPTNLLAEGGQAATAAPIDALTQPQTHEIAAEAQGRWAAVGISAEQQAQLAALGITIADLPDGVLAYAYPDHVQLDATAAGYGWFVDPTPGDDAEFAQSTSASERRALAGSPAYGRMDLLTAIQHEYGHVLGLDDQPTHDHPVALMADTLPTGTRRIPLTQYGSAKSDMVMKSANAPLAALGSFPVTIGGLPAGDRVIITFDVLITNPFPAGADQISHQATVTDDTGSIQTDDPNDATGSSDPTITPIDAQIALTLAKSDGGASVVPGNNVTYTLTYSNTGNQSASGVVLTETVPANTTVHADSVTAGWVCAPDTNPGSTCTYAVGALAGGSGAQTVDFILVLDAAVDESVTDVSNSASIDDDNTSGEDGFATASDTTPINAAPVLTADKTVVDDNGGLLLPGDTLTYTIAISNTGNRDAASVLFTDAIPADTTYVADSTTLDGNPQTDAADADATDFNGTDVQVTMGTITAPSGTVMITFQVTVVNPYPESSSLTITNQGELTAANAPTTPTDDPAQAGTSDPTEIDAIAGLTIQKEFLDTVLEIDQETTLRFTLINPNDSPALTDLSFTDDLPAGLEYVPPAVTPQCAGTVNLVDADSLDFSGGQLAAGPSQCAIDVTVVATGDVTGILTNVTSLLTSAEAVNSRGGAEADARVLAPNEPPPSSGSGGGGAPAEPAETFLCMNLATETNGAMTGVGGIGNVGLNGTFGNSYCHVINLEGQYLPDTLTGSAQLGEPSVIQLGVVQAVDVFGLLPGGFSETDFNTPLSICLRGTGTVYFISSVDHSIRVLPAVQNGGYLCVAITEAGKVVLVGTTNPNVPLPQNAAPQSQPAIAVSQCRVTTTDAPLNLRAEPSASSAVLAKLPYDLTLTATEYLPGAPGWYRVIYGDGQGWVREDFLNTLGDCPS